MSSLSEGGRRRSVERRLASPAPDTAVETVLQADGTVMITPVIHHSSSGGTETRPQLPNILLQLRHEVMAERDSKFLSLYFVLNLVYIVGVLGPQTPL